MHTPIAARAICFGPFQVDPRTRELRKRGRRLRIPEQSVRILLALLDRAGDAVTRDELAAILWPSETVVDVEHGLNSAVRRLQDALGDSAERPVYIETVPRVGYRFVGSVDTPVGAASEIAASTEKPLAEVPGVSGPHADSAPGREGSVSRRHRRLVAATIVLLATVVSIVAWRGRRTDRVVATSSAEPIPLTFDGGLQTDPSMSPDGQWIAYTSSSGGNFDIWIRRLSGRDPVKVTDDEAADSQPDWSPDGSRLVFRSERAGGGLFVVPVKGGTAQRLSPMGFRPRWSPDGRQILFAERVLTGLNLNLQVIDVGGRASLRWPGDARGAFGWQPRSSTVLQLGSLYGSFEPTLVSWQVGSPSVTRWTVADDVRRGFRVHQLVVVGGEEVMPSPGMSSLYFVGDSRGRRALWHIDLDSAARRVVSVPYRVTTLPDANNASLSPDGRRVVFDGSARNAQIVSYAPDSKGAWNAIPMALTSEAIHAHSPTLSRDGRAFGFVLTRPGSPDRSEITARLAGHSRDRTIRVIDHPREVVHTPRWNADGTKLAYSLVVHAAEPAAQQQLRLFDALTGEDVPLTSLHSPFDMMELPTGWTPDGQNLIVTSLHMMGQHDIVLVPIHAAPAAERSGRLVASSARGSLSGAAMSPDARWIAFRVGEQDGLAPRIAVVSSAGGEAQAWTYVTSGREAADKPSWSDDGTTLYFTSGSDSMNVWGIRLDTLRGHPVGHPFQITKFKGPGEHLLSDIRTLGISTGGKRLVVPVVRPKGGLWMLELGVH